LKVLGNFVAVSPVPHQTKTESGIWLAPSQYAEGSEGIVRAIGSGIKEETEYTKKTRVFIEMYKAQAHVYDIENEVFIFLQKNDIIGIDRDGRFQPIRDHVVLKPSRNPRSIIHRPDNYEEDEGGITYHTVYLCGSGVVTKNKIRVPFEVKIGDTVITIANLGRDVMAADGTYKLVKHCDILAIIL